MKETPILNTTKSFDLKGTLCSTFLFLSAETTVLSWFEMNQARKHEDEDISLSEERKARENTRVTRNVSK
jgi:hypothetical protein